MAAMSTRADVPAVPAAPPRSGIGRRLRDARDKGLRMLRGSSLAGRFLVANLAILLVAGVAVGLWVGDRLERSIMERTASVTALYVASIIEPSVASMASGSDLTPEEIATLPARWPSGSARCASGRLTAASSTAPTPASSAARSPWKATWPAPGRARSWPAWTT
jgi:hypothetical protein